MSTDTYTTVTVSGGTVVHHGFADERRASTFCGAEGRRVGGGLNVRLAPGRTVTCRRCHPGATPAKATPVVVDVAAQRAAHVASTQERLDWYVDALSRYPGDEHLVERVATITAQLAAL